MQTKQESTLRRSADYRKRDNALFRARRNLRGTLDRKARRELREKLAELEKAMRRTPVYAARHQTPLGDVRYADDCVLRINGTQDEARDSKNKVEGY